MEKKKIIYLIIFIIALFLTILGSTYAFLTAQVTGENEIKTQSKGYKIEMDILPLYHGFKTIPMDNVDALKALGNQCLDKLGRGACSAYKINIHDYDKSLGSISGKIKFTLNNIINLSYMVLEESDEEGEDCVNVEGENYCIGEPATSVIPDEETTLGDAYPVDDKDNKQFILMIWLTNEEAKQNDYDIGDYQALVTFSMGAGGEIKGVIKSSENAEDTLQSSELK